MEAPDDLPVDVESTLSRFRLGVAAQFELDLWGRLADEREASALEAEASDCAIASMRDSGIIQDAMDQTLTL